LSPSINIFIWFLFCALGLTKISRVPSFAHSTQVFRDLTAEAPQDLVTREMWGSCSSAAEWLQVQNGYVHSMAVTCMVGHLIGLGDRHLDNLLLDLATGEVVHIDYNVCFDKGANLRVPERVPYRLSPIFQHALGVAGVEGGFKQWAEKILATLRDSKDLLLVLLEAFVHDPLVRQEKDEKASLRWKDFFQNRTTLNVADLALLCFSCPCLG